MRTPGISIKSRLILSFGGITAVIFFLMYLIASTWYANNQLDQLDTFLQTESAGIVTTLSTELSRENVSQAEEADLLHNPGFSQFLGLFLQHRTNKPLIFKTTLVVADMNDYIIGASNEALNLDMRVLAIKDARVSNKKTTGETTLFSVKNDRLNYRILQTALISDGQKIGTIRLACLLDPVKRSAKDFLFTSSLFFLLTVLLNILSAIVLVTLILSPVRTMSRTVKEITESKLNSRLTSLPGRDELSMLASTFNHTLQRIEMAYHLQEQLINDLSHQLRTPLTSMRGMVELGLLHAHNPHEYQAILEGSLAGIDRITSLVNTMLSLAKLDSHSEKLRYQPSDLLELINETIDELTPLWDEKSIHFTWLFLDGDIILGGKAKSKDPAATIEGGAELFRISMDRFRLKQAITNILANAYRHTPISGCISIELCRLSAAEGENCRFTIMNDGPPIPENSLEFLFERFYRSDDGPGNIDPAQELRDNMPRGFGLGLNICRRIVEMHHGTIRAYNPDFGGAAFEIILPVHLS